MAHFAKTERERLCAAARKLRVETDIDVNPVCDHAVETVVTELGDQVDLETGLELARVGEQLMAVADAAPVGPGTPRLTVAGAAVYVADKRTDGKAVSQNDVVAAVEASMPSSRWKLRTYAERLEAAVASRRLEGSASLGPAAAD